MPRVAKNTKPLQETNQSEAQLCAEPWFADVYLQKLRPVYLEAVANQSSHERLVTAVRNIYEKTDKRQFWMALTECLTYGLINSPKHAKANAIIDFTVRFVLVHTKANEEELPVSEEEDLLVQVFEHCIELIDSPKKYVRLRCVQMIFKLLHGMSKSAQLSESLYLRIQEALLHRAWDTWAAVRAECVLALNRLQDPTNKECPVVNLFLHMINHDPSAEVRRTVVGAVAMTTKTVSSVVLRSRDVDDSVRRVTFEVLTEKVSSYKPLTITKRVSLLSNGLGDASPSVVSAAKKLTLKWLGLLSGKFVMLLKVMDVATAKEAGLLVIKTLLGMTEHQRAIANEISSMLTPERALKPECINPEAAFLWLCLVKHLQANNENDWLEQFVPTGIEFCNCLSTSLELMLKEDDSDKFLDWIFVQQQLLGLAACIDLTDTFSRQQLIRLLRDSIVANCAPTELIEDLLQVLKQVLAKPEQEFNNMVIELITELRCAAQDAAAAAAGNDTIIANDSTGGNAMPDTGNDDAATEDEETLARCNLIAWKMLWLCDSRRLSPHQRSLVDSLLLPSVKHHSSRVRQFAVSALGIACDRDRSLALTHLPLLVQISKLDYTAVKVAALSGVFDSFLVHGLDVFLTARTDAADADTKPSAADEVDDLFRLLEDDVQEANRTKLSQLSMSADSQQQQQQDAVTTLLSYPISLLDSESPELRTVCVEGLAKLLLFGHVVSPKLLSRLFLLWYNTVTEEDLKLRDCLALFFPAYSFGKCEYQMSVAESAMYTLRTLFNAPPHSPLSEVDQQNVAELLVHLTNADNLFDNQQQQPKPQAVQQAAHDHLALRVASEIARCPNAGSSRVYLRLLAALHVTPAAAGSVLDTLRPVQRKLQERQLLLQLNKLLDSLTACVGCERQAADASSTSAGAAVEPNEEEPTLLEVSSSGQQSNASQFLGHQFRRPRPPPPLPEAEEEQQQQPQAPVSVKKEASSSSAPASAAGEVMELDEEEEEPQKEQLAPSLPTTPTSVASTSRRSAADGAGSDCESVSVTSSASSSSRRGSRRRQSAIAAAAAVTATVKSTKTVRRLRTRSKRT